MLGTFFPPLNSRQWFLTLAVHLHPQGALKHADARICLCSPDYLCQMQPGHWCPNDPPGDSNTQSMLRNTDPRSTANRRVCNYRPTPKRKITKLHLTGLTERTRKGSFHYLTLPKRAGNQLLLINEQRRNTHTLPII